MIEGIFKQKVSYDTWYNNYRWQNETPWETFARVAKAVAEAEEPEHRTYWYDRYYDLLSNCLFTGAGRITSNAGTNLSGSSLVNCFVSGIDQEDPDSIEGIYGELFNQATILKSEGGYGMNFGILRPKGSPIKGTGVLSPGAVAFMRLWNQSSRIITSGEGQGTGGKRKIRKGAMMGVIPIWHPDVLDFIYAKSRADNGLDLFNISVLVSDFFMECVDNDQPWHFMFPDTNHPNYKSEWRGDIDEWIHKYPESYSMIHYGKAKDLWTEIMKVLYQRNEPGILFGDTINHWNNLQKIEKLSATNPCVTIDTFTMTTDGPKQVGDLIGIPFTAVVNGNEYKSTERGFFVTGVKPVFRLITTSGYEVRLTADELVLTTTEFGPEWVKAEDLLPYSSEVLFSDTRKNYDWVGPYGYGEGATIGTIYGMSKDQGRISDKEADIILADLGTNAESLRITTELEKCSSAFCKGFLARFIEYAGMIDDETNRVIVNRDVDTLRGLQRMLGRIGIRSTVQENIVNKGNWTLEFSILFICPFEWQTESIGRYQSKHTADSIAWYLDKNQKSLFSDTMVELVPDGVETVYDCQIPGANCFDGNGFILHNCGEQPLPIGGACVLGSLVLPYFFDHVSKSVDFEKLGKAVDTSVRFLDSVIDITPYPLEKQRIEAITKRRIGTGIMGFGSLLYLMKIRYGSDESVELAEKLMSFITDRAYSASTDLAMQKGPFPKYREADVLSSPFIQERLSESTREAIKTFGLRNSHLISMAPTGTTSIYMNYVSSGVEPVFSHRQFRTVGIGALQTPPDLAVPDSIDWNRRMADSGWTWKTEGDMPVLVKKHNKQVYKLYKERGLTVEEEIVDYAVREMGDNFDPSADWAVTTRNLSVDDHLRVLEVFAKYTDSGVSKTINVPNNYPFEDFTEMYHKAWDSGVIKGVTAYRDGTMASVISDSATEVESEGRPVNLPCNLHRIRVQGNPWIVFVGIRNGKPYEVFAGHDKDGHIPEDIHNGIITRKKSGLYCFEHEGRVYINDISTIFENKANEVDTRMFSTLLRNNVPIEEIIDQLKKCPTTIVNFQRSVIKALSKYVKDGVPAGTCTCGATLVYQNGCANCPACGAAACG